MGAETKKKQCLITFFLLVCVVWLTVNSNKSMSFIFGTLYLLIVCSTSFFCYLPPTQTSLCIGQFNLTNAGELLNLLCWESFLSVHTPCSTPFLFNSPGCFILNCLLVECVSRFCSEQFVKNRKKIYKKKIRERLEVYLRCAMFKTNIAMRLFNGSFGLADGNCWTV